MSRTGFDSKRRAHVPTTNPFHGGTQGGQEERGSVSDEEDGSYGSYHDVAKVELEGEDEYSALTSQTLNNDGTPKRPMNAFMIFARRRRPQVSEENHAMRTGEISKILSKEWNSMPATEKQFYQEQARQLKDTFNLKYPDYVYRRRPNNSRRKRKPDVSGMRPSDGHSPQDKRDDMVFDDIADSPTDGDDIHAPEVITDMHRARPSHDVQARGDQPTYHPSSSRTSPYAYPPSEPSRRPSVHEDPSSYAVDSACHENPSGQSPHARHKYPYIRAQSHIHTQYVPIYQGSVTTGNWNFRPSSWLGPTDQTDRTPSPLVAPKAHRPSTSPTWQRTHPTGHMSSGSPALLQTLSSPFFPSDASPGAASPLSHSQPMTPAPYDPMQSLMVGRELNDFATVSPSLADPSHSYHPDAGREGSLYAQRQPSTPRSLPPTSNYSLSQPAQFPPSADLGGLQGYWAQRDSS
ncbi:hypothetical protein DXG03_008366 [Asterophora parasitica]|uniref:HMG box domain-containing protein n=1 Tax=Asterophora parasitica TaxID=117018 RepID=A0A9P7G802_9AGAR|nr:hypothetical protein DXG03_008366 [Asterophora parasitica]